MNPNDPRANALAAAVERDLRESQIRSAITSLDLARLSLESAQRLRDQQEIQNALQQLNLLEGILIPLTNPKNELPALKFVTEEGKKFFSKP